MAASDLDNFQVGDIVAVDWDYRGETGYVGAGAPAAYVAAAMDVATHMDFIRRVTFNVSRVSSKTAYSLVLGQRLMGGAQTGMGVQKVAALLDREGGTYFQEWAALFVVVGGTGGRACFYYPRLQAAASTSEVRQEVEAPLFNTSAVNVVTGRLSEGRRVERTEKVEKGKRYQLVVDSECDCVNVKPLEQ